MIQSANATNRFRVPILHALYELSDGRSVRQLCELAWRYAESGDEAFRSRLYEIVEQKPISDCPWLGEEEIVALDGQSAFLFAAAVRGRNLPDRDWDWDDGRLVDLAVERFGEGFISGLLSNGLDKSVNHFLERWKQEPQLKAGKSGPASHKERMAAIPVEEIIRAAKGKKPCYWFRGWGKQAEEESLRVVLQYLWSEKEPTAIANLLRVFSGRALPEFDPRLVEFCRHSDDEVRQRAFVALELNTHPLIREFALAELQKRLPDDSVVGLFINNYQSGDEQIILEAIELPDNVCELHSLLMDVIKVLETYPEADCSRLGVISYALTPCENCRYHAARHLLKQNVAPEWLIEECRHDSGEDCRKSFLNAGESTEGN